MEVCTLCQSSILPVKKEPGKGSLLSSHLEIIFLLSKVVEVPPSLLTTFLKSCPSPVPSWIVLCDPCHRLGKEAKAIHEQICELNRKWAGVQGKLLEGIKRAGATALEETEGSSDSPRGRGLRRGRARSARVSGKQKRYENVEEIRREIREFAINHEYQRVDQDNPFPEGDLKALQLAVHPQEAAPPVPPPDSPCPSDPDPEWTPCDDNDDDSPHSPVADAISPKEDPDSLDIKKSLAKPKKKGKPQALRRCGYCHLTFRHQYSLVKHRKTVHNKTHPPPQVPRERKPPPPSKHPCPACPGSTFKSHHAYKMHMLLEHQVPYEIREIPPEEKGTPPVELPPNLPRPRNPLYQTFKLHKTYNGVQVAVVHRRCLLCQKVFRLFSSIRAHLLSEHPTAPIPPHFRAQEVKRQSTEPKNERRYTCPVCHILIPRDTTFKRHLMLAHQLTAPPPAKCSQCGKVFPHHSQLRSHQRNPGGCRAGGTGRGRPPAQVPKTFRVKCAVAGCDFQTGDTQELNSHQRETHTPAEIDGISPLAKVFLCGECGAAFRFKGGLQKHWGRVHKPKIAEEMPQIPVRCLVDDCHSEWPTVETLREHQKRDHVNAAKRQKVQCTKCDRICKHAWHLKDHLREMHGETRKVRKGDAICEVCGAAFDSEERVKSHQRQSVSCKRLQGLKEEELGTVICDSCGGTFANKYILEMHMAARHGVKKTGKN